MKNLLLLIIQLACFSLLAQSDYSDKSIIRLTSESDFYTQAFYRDQIILFNGSQYLVTDNSEGQTVDSVFVIPVQAAEYDLPNLITSYAFGNGDSLECKQVNGISPKDGFAYRINPANSYPINDDNAWNKNKVLVNRMTTVNNQEGDKVTVQFSYRFGSGCSDEAQIVVDQSRMDEPDIYITASESNRDWTTFQATFTQKNSDEVATNIRINLRFNLCGNDTVWISDHIIQEGQSITNYRGWSSYGDKLFAKLITPPNEVAFEDVNFFGRYDSEAEQLNALMAFAWAERKKDVQNYVVRVNDLLEVTESVKIPEHISLIGGAGEFGNVPVIADLNAPLSDVFRFVETGGFGSVYNQGQAIKGFDIQVRSKCRAVIDMRCGSTTEVSNIMIRATDRNGNNASWTDSLFRYGVATALDCGLQGLGNSIDNVWIRHAWDFGFFLKDTKIKEVDRARVGNGNRAIYADGIQIQFNRLWVEGLHNTGIVLRGAQASFWSPYFESVGEIKDGVGIPQDNYRYLIDADGLESLSIRDYTVTGVPGNGPQAYFKLRNTTTTTIENYRGGQNSTEGQRPVLLDADCSNGAVFLSAVNYTYGIDDSRYVCPGLVEYIGLYDHDLDAYKSKLDNVLISQGKQSGIFSDNSTSYNSTFVGQNLFDREVSIKAWGQNRITYSEDYFANPWRLRGDIRISLDNNVPKPVDGMTVTKVQYDTAASSINTQYRIQYDPGNDLWELGENYLLTLWVLPGSVTTDTITIFTSSEDRYRSSSRAIVDPIAGWQRITHEVSPSSYSDDKLFIDFWQSNGDRMHGDSLWIGGVQIQEIPKGMNGAPNIMPTYIKTAGNWDLIPNRVKWNLESPLDISGEINIEKYEPMSGAGLPCMLPRFNGDKYFDYLSGELYFAWDNENGDGTGDGLDIDDWIKIK